MYLLTLENLVWITASYKDLFIYLIFKLFNPFENPKFIVYMKYEIGAPDLFIL